MQVDLWSTRQIDSFHIQGQDDGGAIFTLTLSYGLVQDQMNFYKTPQNELKVNITFLTMCHIQAVFGFPDYNIIYKVLVYCRCFNERVSYCRCFQLNDHQMVNILHLRMQSKPGLSLCILESITQRRA